VTHVTQQMLQQAIAAQKTGFVTHDIVRYLYTHYQHEYLKELTAHSNARYPFTETHRQIGQAVAQLRRLVRKTGKVKSKKTMRGKPTPVESWRK
jgi:hypothetical protein